jgi:NAD(P)-dependent dehydrogenase (short-subunit alcohol dehydrogenase family)
MSTTKSIVITGASSGIGAALTLAFTGDGHRLFVCARRTDRLAKFTEALPATFAAGCDVTSETEVERFFAHVRERTPSVDVLIHCAAVMGPIGLVTDVASEEWLEALKTDLFGAFLVTKHVVPLMRAENRPRILLLSGGGAFDPMPNLSAYGVAKAGIVRLAETLAVELAPRNIAVNVFAPGFVKTDIFSTVIEAGRERGGMLYDTVIELINQWQDSDIELPINCARFLISDAAAPLTGKTISARYDPWDAPEFVECLQEIVDSKLYATQRTNAEHLKGQAFADRLADAARKRKPGHAVTHPLAARQNKAE